MAIPQDRGLGEMKQLKRYAGVFADIAVISAGLALIIALCMWVPG